jgi:streptogramin lyase
MDRVLSVHASRLLPIALVCCVAAFLVSTASAAESKLAHKLPLATHAYALTIGSDGAIWFRGRHGSSHEDAEGLFIGRLGAGGALKEFPLPGSGALVAAPDGDIWFPMSDNDAVEIVRLSPSGQTQRYALGTEVTSISAMTTMNGDLWFTGAGLINGEPRATIGRIAISADGAVQQFPLESECRSHLIAAAGGTVWFGELCGQSSSSEPRASISRLDPSGTVVRHRLPASYYPTANAVGPEGTIWFAAERNSYRAKGIITRIAADVAEYRVPHSADLFESIAVGPGGRLWFPSSFGGGLTRGLNSINTNGQLGKPICVSPGCKKRLGADVLATAPDGRLWFAVSRVRSLGGGGLTGIIESQTIGNEAGFIGRLVP